MDKESKISGAVWAADSQHLIISKFQFKPNSLIAGFFFLDYIADNTFFEEFSEDMANFTKKNKFYNQ